MQHRRIVKSFSANKDQSTQAVGELTAKVIIKPGTEKALARRHPWVFSGGVHQPAVDPSTGHTVALMSESGQFRAWGAYSPHSQIRLRIWSYDPAMTIDAAFFHTPD